MIDLKQIRFEFQDIKNNLMFQIINHETKHKTEQALVCLFLKYGLSDIQYRLKFGINCIEIIPTRAIDQLAIFALLEKEI